MNRTGIIAKSWGNWPKQSSAEPKAVSVLTKTFWRNLLDVVLFSEESRANEPTPKFSQWCGFGFQNCSHAKNRFMKPSLTFCLILVGASLAPAQPNLLYNGDFELHTLTNFYYNPGASSPDSPVAVPGWEAFATNDSSSWVLVSQDGTSGNWVLDLSGSSATASDLVGLAGMQTAITNRPVVTPGAGYSATVTYDNNYDPVGIAYFIDWFDASGVLLGSSGGGLNDPNGPGNYAPLTQAFEIDGVAPAGAARAGVRFQSASATFEAARADNFQSTPLNLLYNGDFELHSPANFYYNPGAASPDAPVAVPGWEAFAANDSSSWVLVGQDGTTGNWVLDLSGSSAVAADLVGLAGMQTAVTNRPAVTSGVGYYATVNYDNNYDPVGISYFIDWFDASGALLSSSGGALDDPNGPATYAPLTQSLAITGVAPLGAARAGVRFQSASATFEAARADHFQLAVQPVLSIVRSGSQVTLSWTKGPGFSLQKTSDVSGAPVWTGLGTQNPQTLALDAGNAFFQVSNP